MRDVVCARTVCGGQYGSVTGEGGWYYGGVRGDAWVTGTGCVGMDWVGDGGEWAKWVGVWVIFGGCI